MMSIMTTAFTLLENEDENENEDEDEDEASIKGRKETHVQDSNWSSGE